MQESNFKLKLLQLLNRVIQVRNLHVLAQKADIWKNKSFGIYLRVQVQDTTREPWAPPHQAWPKIPPESIIPSTIAFLKSEYMMCTVGRVSSLLQVAARG